MILADMPNPPGTHVALDPKCPACRAAEFPCATVAKVPHWKAAMDRENTTAAVNQPDSIGESLEEFATRTGMPVPDAYRAWHAHGNAIAMAWHAPSSVQFKSDEYSPMQKTISGGRCLGIYQ